MAVLIGAFSGAFSAAFLWSLALVTAIRNEHPWLINMLPLAGCLIGWLYHQFGKDLEAGNNLIIDEVFEPKTSIRFRLAPLVFIGTIATHLFGGSAGREGTAVQMGGATADFIGRLAAKRFAFDRRQLLICGVAAGFASVFGTPLAACVFAFELFGFRYLRLQSVFVCTIAAGVAHLTALNLGAYHANYRSIAHLAPTFDTFQVVAILVAGLVFGVIARTFAWSTHTVARLFERIRYSPFRPLLGGLLFAGLVISFHLERYQGLGLPIINEALRGSGDPKDFILKTFLTALTLGSGFKGGEVTPLFFIGATAGQALAPLFSVSSSLLAAAGFVAVFAGAANVPLASIVMAGELFGWESTLYFALACLASFSISGRYGIYRAQRPQFIRFKIF